MKLLLIAAALFFAGCSKPTTQETAIVEAPVVAGRYQLLQLGEMRRDQYLIDTATGRVWNSVCAVPSKKGNRADCEYNAFSQVDVVGIDLTQPEYWNKIEAIDKLVKRQAGK